MDKSEVIKKLKRQRHLLLDLQAKSMRDAAFTKWKRDTEVAIESVFGKTTRHLSDFSRIRWWPAPYGGGPDAGPQAFMNGRREADAVLLSMIEEVNEYWQESGGRAEPNERAVNRMKSRNVFVVHGRNEAFRESVARFLEKLNLNPIILHEQPNRGRTIIEKFVDYSDVAFAVVLLTADDRGGLSETPFEDERLRARQNVILELGFFIGLLGRECVCALYEDGVEIPSDYDGVVFVRLDKDGAWRVLLAREIKGCGLPITVSDAI